MSDQRITRMKRLVLELDDMRKKGPPPRQWNGNKPLPWPIAIFYEGRTFYDVLAYNLDEGYFDPTDGIPRQNTDPDGFLVQRMH